MKSVEVRNLRLILQLGKPNRKSDRCSTHRILLIHTTDGGEGPSPQRPRQCPQLVSRRRPWHSLRSAYFQRGLGSLYCHADGFNIRSNPDSIQSSTLALLASSLSIKSLSYSCH